MAAHSGILAWEIPWTEKPSEQQSMRLQKSWTKLNMHAHTYNTFENYISFLKMTS